MRLVVPLVLLVLFVLVISRNRRSQQQQQAQQREGLLVGARVMTTSGLHGTVLEVGEDTVVLEIAPGVRTTWLSRAVSRRVDDPAGTTTPAGTDPVDPVLPPTVGPVEPGSGEDGPVPGSSTRPPTP